MSDRIIPIEELRKKIDNIDKDIVRLFKERMYVAADIADYKRANGMPVYDPAREKQLLSEISQLAGSEFADYSKVLYNTILSLSKSYQRSLMGENSDSSETIRKV